MEIKLKNQVFVNGYAEALGRLLQEKLPPMSSYSLAKFADQVSKQAERYNKVRLKLLREYAEKGEDDKPIIEDNRFKLLEGKEDEFNNKFKELIEIEEGYELMNKITLPDDLEILPADIILLEDILELK